MFYVKLADFSLTIKNRYRYVRRIWQDYISSVGSEITIECSDEELDREKRDDRCLHPAYLESVALWRKVVESLLDKDVVLFHSSALAVNGKAYLFTAPSGTGKSTHARLWRQCFGDRVTMINDDKPLLKIGETEIRAYGTPYGGKHNIQANISVPVAGIVILHQAPENSIFRVTEKEAYPTLLQQTYLRRDPEGMVHTLDLVKTLSHLPIWQLGCTVSREAAKLAYDALIGE